MLSFDPSGMNTMAASDSPMAGANSRLLAPGRPSTLRVYSITAAWSSR
jgi:hypothetical protein